VMLAYPAWPQTGLAWIEAFDELDLMRMHDMVRPLKPQDPARSTIAGMLLHRLHPVFCPPKVKPPKKVYEPKKPPNGARIGIEQGLSTRVRTRTVSWSRLSEQNLREDKWNVCRVKPPSGMAVG
jgi:hypothetical protein